MGGHCGQDRRPYIFKAENLLQGGQVNGVQLWGKYDTLAVGESFADGAVGRKMITNPIPITVNRNAMNPMPLREYHLLGFSKRKGSRCLQGSTVIVASPIPFG
jgi:hypothetical protein